MTDAMTYVASPNRRAVNAGQRGLPRPILDGLPAPYSGDNRDHGEPSQTRLEECQLDDLCGVCGEKLDARRYIAVYHEPEFDQIERPHPLWLLVADNVAMHERCAKLSLAHCPHMRSGKSWVVWVDDMKIRPITPSPRLTAQQLNERRLMLKSTAKGIVTA